MEMNDLPFGTALLLSAFLLLAIPIRILIRKYSASFPLSVIIFPLAWMIGTLIYYIPSLESYATVTTIPPALLPAIYLPIYIFSTVYNSDHYIFMRCLPQVIIISIAIFMGMTLVLSTIIKDVLHHKLTIQEGMIASIVCLPIQPNNIITILKDIAKYKYLGTFLEAEALITIIPVLIFVEVSYGYLDQFQTKTSQQIFVCIRYLLIAVIIGYLIGKIAAKLMGFYYNLPRNVLTISICVTFMTYYLCEFILYTSGPLALIILSCQVMLEKHRFTTEVENCMSSFWGILIYMSEKIFLMLLVVITTYYFWLFFETKDLFGSVILFFTANVVRFLIFLVLYPIMKFLRYNISVRCLLVLCWSGVKGSVNLMLIHTLLSTRSTSKFTQMYFMEIMVYTYLSMFLNSASMKVVVSLLGMAELSNTRKTNMAYCLQHIMQKRTYIINIFKLNSSFSALILKILILLRYLSDVNWKLVRRETVVKNPYTDKEEHGDEIEEEDNDDDDDNVYVWQAGSLVCPDCVKEVPFDISEEDIREMIKEEHIKILKAKKVSIIKQYENGVISKNCVQMLVYTFEVMIDSNSQSSYINLDNYLKKSKFLTVTHYIIRKLNERSVYKPPTSYWRRLCFYIVMHKTYNYIVFIYNLTFIIILAYFHDSEEEWLPPILNYIIATIILFTLEMVIKVLALSEQKISQGLSLYFGIKFNVFDFCLLLGQYCDMIIFEFHLNKNFRSAPLGIKLSAVIGALRLFKILDLLHPLYSRALKALDYRIDSKICIGYDLASALVNCCDEVLMMIGNIVEVNIIKSLYVKQLQLEKLELIKIMEEVQSERPYIAITVKTKQAIRTTLSAMEDALNDLKVSGYVDNVEYLYIFKEIFDKQNYLRNLKFVQPNSPKILFFEVPWMVDDIVKEYLFRHAQKVVWDKGEVVCREGKTLPGVFVVVGGLLRLTYMPRSSTIESMKSFGTIPIVDYYTSIKFEEEWEDRITTGNSIGELSLLTGRPYDCTLVADSSSKAFLLTTDVINRAIKLSKHPINGLEARMWKCSIINLAIAVLANVPLYQMLTPEQIKFKLQRAFMPNLSCYKMFVITDMMADVLLMEGMVSDYSYGHMFVAPMHLPRSSQKLMLPKSSYFDFDDKMIAKLLVIPVANAEEDEIMIEEEQLAEFVHLPSSSCLLHAHDENIHAERSKLLIKNNVEAVITTYSSAPITNNDIFEIIEPAPSLSNTVSAKNADGSKRKLVPQIRTLSEKFSKKNLNK